MDKQEQQDKFWNELSEEKKEEYRDLYQKGLDYVRNEDSYLKGLGQGELSVIVDVFGEHNLQNPEPQIKTWEDVLKYNLVNPLIIRESAGYAEDVCGEKISDKVESTLKIAKLIELGYGGMVSEEEWCNNDIEKWTIVYHPRSNTFDFVRINNNIHFITFHTLQQAEEFMSYESNRKLVEMYYLM